MSKTIDDEAKELTEYILSELAITSDALAEGRITQEEAFRRVDELVELTR